MARLRAILGTIPILLILLPLGAAAQEGPTLIWHGEIRPRMESREPVEGSWDHLTSMRTRVTLDARFPEGLRLYFQLQDVRNWGEEGSVRDRSADNMDFHQAYLEIEDLPGVGGRIRAGRQEVGLAASRLIGAPDWGQGGQSFDGARWFRSLPRGRLELLALRIKEGSTPAHQGNGKLLAAWLSLPEVPGGSVDLYLVHDHEDEIPQEESPGTRQSTVGGIWAGEWGPLELKLHGIFQGGTRQGLDVEATFFSAQASLPLLEDRASAALWYDRLSGSEDPGEGRTEAFSTIFGARNRYYGRADYFVDIPGNTRGLGLQDAVLKLSFDPLEDLSLNLDIHAFRTVAQGSLPTSRLGEEADLWVRIQPRDHLVVQTGYAITRAAGGMEDLGILEGTGHFGYVMASVRF